METCFKSDIKLLISPKSIEQEVPKRRQNMKDDY